MAEKSENIGSDIRILYPILMNSSFDRADLEDEIQFDVDEELEGFFGGSIKLLPDHEGIHAAQCDFRAGMSKKAPDGDDEGEQEVFSVSATYLVAFRGAVTLSSDLKKTILEQSALAAAWPLFRTLFSQITTQSCLDSKPLPQTTRFDWVANGKK